MNANLVQGTTKGRPNLYQGAKPGTGALGGPTRVVNQTLGWETNHTVNYAYVLRRFKSGFDRALRIGQIVFIRKTEPKAGQNERMFTLMNLPQMNYYLAKLQAEKTGLTAAEILNEWAPHGIVQGEVGADDQPQERLLNLTVAGRVRMFNVFGNATDGTPLYVILKKKKIASGKSKHFIVALNGNSEHVNVPSNLWQFEAYADPEKHYPDETTLGDDGRAIYVGRVSHNGKFSTATQLHIDSAHTDIQRHVTLPMMEIFFDYEPVALPAYGLTSRAGPNPADSV